MSNTTLTPNAPMSDTPIGTSTAGPAVPDTAHVDRQRYLAPDRLTKAVMNPLVTGLVKIGVSIRGSRQLQVRGRRSGEWRSVPVNPLEIDGVTYLVAPRGHTQWVRNLRAAGEGRLRRGRRFTEFDAVELVDSDKTPILRAYLDKWAFEVAKFFEGIDVNSSDQRLGEVVSGFPVFRITPR